MSTTLPLQFQAAPLPADFTGTPQQFLDAIVARLAVASDESFSVFTIGSTAPTSDIGPWLKNGITWYVWDTGTGTYIPSVMEFRSLKYIASTTAPDQNIYKFWIELSGAGKAIAIKYYSGGAWKDVYEDKFATFAVGSVVTAAIVASAAATLASANATTATAAAAASLANQQYPFRARKNAAAQAYTAGDGDTQIVFDTEDYDVGNNFAGNQYTAPAAGYYTFKAQAYLSNVSGAPTNIDRQMKIRVGGTPIARKNIQINDLLGGSTVEVSVTYQLNAGQIVDVVTNVTSTGASGWSLDNDSTTTFFEGHRVLTQ